MFKKIILFLILILSPLLVLAQPSTTFILAVSDDTSVVYTTHLGFEGADVSQLGYKGIITVPVATDTTGWTHSGDYIYSLTDHSVGIGTTDPTSKLHILGNLLVSGTGTFNILSITNPIDISSQTNLSGDTENVLTGDVLSIGSTITRDTEWNTIDFLVGTATGSLSGEVVAGTAPGGELGGTWASPTVDATHSGSAHHSAVTITDTTTINLGLTGQDITADGLYTAGDNITLTGADFDVDDVFLLNTGDIGSGTYNFTGNVSTLGNVGIGNTNPTTQLLVTGNITADTGTFSVLNIGSLSGILKGTTGVVSAITDSSANWDTAYNHSQDNTQAHSDYLLNNANDETSGILTAAGFITTGTGTFSTLSISNVDLGDITVTSNNWAVEDDSHAHTSSTLSSIDISADTNLTAGDALTLTDDDIDFDGGTAPGGELGNTWVSPTIDDSLAVTSWSLTTPTIIGGGTFNNGSTSAGFLDIYEDTDDGSNYTRIQVPAMVATITYTLPADDGEVDEVLSTNGLGVLDWVAAGTGDITAVGDALTGAVFAAGDSDSLLGDLVGVGATAPTAFLNIKPTTVTPIFILKLADTSANDRLVVQSDGKVGIGLTNPSTQLHLTGDLTIGGGDITLDTSAIFSGGDTTSLNLIDAIDATTETTLEGALDIAGEVTSTGMSSTVIGDSIAVTSWNLTTPTITTSLTTNTPTTLTAAELDRLDGLTSAIIDDDKIDTFAELDAIVADKTLVNTTNKLSDFAATTSAELAGVISDEQGSGSLVFATSPTLVTPTLGAATATTLDTGQGANELYDMNQNVQTTDNVVFKTLKTSDTVPIMRLNIKNPDTTFNKVGSVYSTQKAMVIDKMETICPTVASGTSVIFTLKTVGTDGTGPLTNLSVGQTSTIAKLSVTTFTGGTLPAGFGLIIDDITQVGGTAPVFRLEIFGHEN